MDILVLDLTFGEWLIETRERLRLRPSDCAKAAGLHVSQWSDFETGRSRRKDGQPSTPTLKTVRAIAKGLGVPVKNVLEGLENAGIDTSEYNIPTTLEDAERASDYVRSPTSQADLLRGEYLSESAVQMTREEAKRLLDLYRRKPPKARQAAKIAADAILSQFPDIPIKETPPTEESREESQEEPIETLEAPLREATSLPGLLLNVVTGELVGPQGVISKAKAKDVCALAMQILAEWMTEEPDKAYLKKLLTDLSEKLQMPRATENKPKEFLVLI